MIYAMIPKVEIDKDTFIKVFDAWLLKNRSDGNFYKDAHGWFIMSGAKRKYMPKAFQDYQKYRGYNTDEKPN